MSRRALALAVILALLTPVAALAQTGGVTRTRLPNGLTVVVRKNPAAPVVAYSLLVKMGTRTETPDNAGISNMLQTLLVRGTEKMDVEQIAAAADRMGGSIDAYGDADYSEITATALSHSWQPMLELVADVALRPTVPEGTVGAVRDFLGPCIAITKRRCRGGDRIAILLPPWIYLGFSIYWRLALVSVYVARIESNPHPPHDTRTGWSNF